MLADQCRMCSTTKHEANEAEVESRSWKYIGGCTLPIRNPWYNEKWTVGIPGAVCPV